MADQEVTEAKGDQSTSTSGKEKMDLIAGSDMEESLNVYN